MRDYCNSDDSDVMNLMASNGFDVHRWIEGKSARWRKRAKRDFEESSNSLSCNGDVLLEEERRSAVNLEEINGPEERTTLTERMQQTSQKEARGKEKAH